MSDPEDDLLAELEAIVGETLGNDERSGDVASPAVSSTEPASGVSFEEFLALQGQLSEVKNKLFDAEEREKKYRAHIKKLQTDPQDGKTSARQLITNVFKRSPKGNDASSASTIVEGDDTQQAAAQVARQHDAQLQELREEIDLHKQTKDELARQVKATKLDLEDQRRIYKRSMADLSQKNTELAAKLAQSTKLLDAQAVTMEANSSRSPSTDPDVRIQEVPNTASHTMSSDAVELATQLKLAQQRELELSDQLASLQQELAVTQSQSTRATEDREGEVKDNETLRDQLKQANRRLEDQQHALRQREADAKVRKEDLDKTQTELDVTKAQLTDVCKQLEDTTLRAEWALNNIEEVKQQRDAAKARTASIEAELQEATDKVTRAEATMKAQQQAHLKAKAKLEQSLSQAQQSHTKAIKQLTATHNKELTALRATLGKERDQIQASKDKELAALKTSLEKEQKDAQERLALAARLRTEGQDKDSEIARLTSLNTSEVARSAQLQQQVQDLQTAKISLTQELHLAKDAMDDLGRERSARQAMEKESEMLLGASQASTESLKTLQAEMQACITDLAAATALQAELEKQLLEASQQLAAEQEMRHDVQSKYEASVAEVTELQTHTIQVQEQLAQTTAQAEEERTSLASEMTYLTGQLNEEMQMREKLGVQVKDLQEEARLQQKKSANAMKDLAKQLAQANRKLAQAASSKSEGDTISLSSVASDESRQSSRPELVPVSLHDSPRASAPCDTPTRTHLQRQGSTSSSRKCLGVVDNTVITMASILVGALPPSRTSSKQRSTDFSLDKLRAKVQFLETHVGDLTDTIKAKNRLLQHYYLREKRGQLASTAAIPSQSKVSADRDGLPDINRWHGHRRKSKQPSLGGCLKRQRKRLLLHRKSMPNYKRCLRMLCCKT
eukprot:m.166599 g.166599  ORF g.166599 m.166599 type:complete len:908 (+) comp16626_c0_seq12:122-2845(+)